MKRACLLTLAAGTLLGGIPQTAGAAVYVGLGEFNGYVSTAEGIFDVQYSGDMQIEFDTLYHEETTSTMIMVDLACLDAADWFSGENSGAAMVSLSSGSFVPPTDSPGGPGEVYDPFAFDIAGVTSTSLFLAPEWTVSGDELDLSVTVEEDPSARTAPWRGAPMRVTFRGSSDLVAVPEPVSAWLLGAGLLGWAGVLSRRRRR